MGFPAIETTDIILIRFVLCVSFCFCSCSGIYLEKRCMTPKSMKKECCNFGQVKRVLTLDGSAYGGCAAITFQLSEAAQACREKMHGRLFDGRSLEAYVVDRKREVASAPATPSLHITPLLL